MSKKAQKLMEFNRRNIFMINVSGAWWIAIKPICGALMVDYEAQRKNLYESKVLCQLPSVQTVVAADGRLRKMVCLPEFAIYGWIFQIESDAPGLEEYQWYCRCCEEEGGGIHYDGSGRGDYKRLTILSCA